MQHAEIQRNQRSLVVQLRSDIVDLLAQDEVSEGLVIRLLNLSRVTSDPPAMVLKICEDFSLRVEILEAVQVSMSLILIPLLLESIPSESRRKAAFQLYSMNWMNSLREITLSPSLS